TRITCILGMKRIYGLKHIRFVQIGTISVYTLLDEHKADGGDGFSTDPQQLQKKYIALVDDKHIFGFQNVAPVVKKSLLSRLVGGECSYFACMPTKTMLRTTELGSSLERAPGLHGQRPEQDGVWAWRDAITDDWDDAGQLHYLQDWNCRLVRGEGRVAQPGTVEID